MTLVTTKCFSRLRGFTAVHLVSKSFFGLSVFMRAWGPGEVVTSPDLGFAFIGSDDAARVNHRPLLASQPTFTSRIFASANDRLMSVTVNAAVERGGQQALQSRHPARSLKLCSGHGVASRRLAADRLYRMCSASSTAQDKAAAQRVMTGRPMLTTEGNFAFTA